VYPALRGLCPRPALSHQPGKAGGMNGIASSDRVSLRKKRRLRRLLRDVSPWLATISFFLVWELGCRLLGVPEFILPTPSSALAALIEFRDGIWFNAYHTLLTTLVGFGLAVVFGVALGV